VLRTVFAPNRDEVTGNWRTFPNEKIHNFQAYFTANISRVIKLRRVTRAGHVTRTEGMRNTSFYLENLLEGDHYCEAQE
jgi:hypothetical protein